MKMTLRQLLNSITSQVKPEDEDKLLDAEITIKIPHACGTYSVTTTPKATSVKQTWDNINKVDECFITIDCNLIM